LRSAGEGFDRGDLLGVLAEHRDGVGAVEDFLPRQISHREWPSISAR
jgi:hypothetical protein